jgi:CRISPR-associated endonuclease/helicase Cas3
MSEENSILLKGLDGSNPLAFLAALGTLRTLTLALRDETVKMSWEQYEGAWRPRAWCSLANDGDAVIAALEQKLIRDRALHPTRFIDYKSSNKEAVEFYVSVRLGGPIGVEQDSWIASLTNDVHPEATSPLQLTRSDYFVGNLDQIIAKTTDDHLRKSLHLEPTEDRRHAYQWNQPSGDPNRNKTGNMLGANRLAIEALPLFLALPSNNPARLFLTGWTGVRSDDATWTWPIWNAKIGLDVVKSILALAELQAARPNPERLIPSGVPASYRSRRILVEKTPNFTPSVCVI